MILRPFKPFPITCREAMDRVLPLRSIICSEAMDRVRSPRLTGLEIAGSGRDPSRPYRLTSFFNPIEIIQKKNLVAYVLFGLLALLITSCNWPGAQQTSQPDPRLKAFHVVSARIIMLDTQAEVDGTLQNTNQRDRFPYDVTIIATFYNSAGNIVGQAGGVAEDVYPGMTSPFTLVGQVDSTQYSHMVVTVVSLKERRIEKLIPTPSIVP